MPSLQTYITRDPLFNMADEERNRMVAEFSGVTDADAERAKFYLESSGWDLHVSNKADLFFFLYVTEFVLAWFQFVLHIISTSFFRMSIFHHL